MTGNYKAYEIPSEQDLLKCKQAIWRGLFHRSEGIGFSKRIFILINPNNLITIKKKYPSMSIKEVN